MSYKIKSIKKSFFAYGSKTGKECVIVNFNNKSSIINLDKLLYSIFLVQDGFGDVLIICDNLNLIDLMLIKSLYRLNYSITIQTSGETEIDPHWRMYLDSIILKPVSDHSLVNRCDDLVIKYPIFNDNTTKELAKIDHIGLFISPVFSDDYKSNLSRSLRFIDDLDEWKISLPIHRNISCL